MSEQSKAEQEFLDSVLRAGNQVYYQPYVYAQGHNEVVAYFESREQLSWCACALEHDARSISCHSQTDIHGTLAVFGLSYVEAVLLNHLDNNACDFSEETLRWAQTIPRPKEYPPWAKLDRDVQPEIVEMMIENVREVSRKLEQRKAEHEKPSQGKAEQEKPHKIKSRRGDAR